MLVSSMDKQGIKFVALRVQKDLRKTRGNVRFVEKKSIVVKNFFFSWLVFSSVVYVV